jgi:ABC-type dipeptide/oligopeptide/nickel transport system ATPase subunit
MSDALLKIKNVYKSYPGERGDANPVLNGINLILHRGESLGLMGDSGSGKSTLARLVLGIEKPDSGEILFNGRPITDFTKTEKRNYCKELQIVWQDPAVYLNPYLTVESLIAEPLLSFGMKTESWRRARARELMAEMGLPERIARSRPARLSGGQCQRVAIARAISINPSLLILDEALVNLDLPQQVHILKLLEDLQNSLQTSFLFISHDPDTVNRLCTRKMVL